MIIIGSKSLYNKFNNVFKERIENSDFDVIMSFSDFSSWFEKYKEYVSELIPRSSNKYRAIINYKNKRHLFEIELDEVNSSSLFLLENKKEVTEGYYVDFFGEKWSCLKSEFLMLTKKSHLYFPVHFEKNINDYHFLKSNIGIFNINKIMDKYYKLRKSEAEKRFKENHRTPKLNISNEDFFKISGKSEGRVFVHDDLHEIVKHFDKPIYEMLKKEENFEMAWCEKDMFFDLPFDYQIKCVQEEAYVIALERYIIPKEGNFEDFFWCYKRALMRICTTLCSGFFRDFAIENYNLIIDQYKSDFYYKYLKAYEDNVLIPMKGRKVA